jgi:hypothetical protein
MGRRVRKLKYFRAAQAARALSVVQWPPAASRPMSGACISAIQAISAMMPVLPVEWITWPSPAIMNPASDPAWTGPSGPSTDEEWLALTIVTRAPFRLPVPPLLNPVPLMP